MPLGYAKAKNNQSRQADTARVEPCRAQRRIFFFAAAAVSGSSCLGKDAPVKATP
jgi:hypothetical protein